MIEVRTKAILLLLSLAALLCVAQPAQAQRAVDFSPENIDRWVNATFAKAYDQGRISGIGIIAVQDGRIVYRKSIGYADYAQKRPIDPAVTRFRIGSATKTFVALAIAKLVEQGRIRSLDDPANRYLKRMKLPPMAGREITLWDLLNHRGAFEEPVWAYDLTSRPMSAEDIAKNMPRQDPGARAYANYCNFCSATLGLVVEDVTGELLQDHLDRVIFRPLGMDHSLLTLSRWPTVNLGKTYLRAKGKAAVLQPYVAIPEFYAPAGSIDATMDDMARYMTAVLGGPGSEIVSQKSWETLLGRHFGNHPAANAFGMIWMAHEWNGVEVREHGGAINGYHSMTSLFPEAKAGIFISCFCPDIEVAPKPGVPFGLTGYNFREMLYRHFLGTPVMRALPVGNLDAYVGTYKTETRDSRWPADLGFLLRPKTIEVKMVKSGLTIDGKGPYRRVGDDLFRFPGLNSGDPFIPYPNAETMIFLRGNGGTVERITGQLSLHTAKKLAFFERPATQLGIWFGATGLLALGFLSFAWKRGSDRDRRLHRLLCATALLGSVSTGLIVAAFRFDWFPWGLLAAERQGIATALAAGPFLTAIATLLCVPATIAIWREEGASRRRPALAILVITGGAALSAFFIANA